MKKQCAAKTKQGIRCKHITPTKYCRSHTQKAGSCAIHKTKQIGSGISSLAQYALSSKKNYKEVHDFLTKKYNSENIEFLKLVREYEQQPNVSNLVNIYFQFIDKDSDKQINLPADIQNHIENIVMGTPIVTLEADPNFFDKAKNNIENLLNANYLKDFQK